MKQNGIVSTPFCEYMRCRLENKIDIRAKTFSGSEGKWSNRNSKEKKKEKQRESKMGYVLRVRLASFFAGAATASSFGFYTLHKDYKVAHESISQQVKRLHKSLDKRIFTLETLKESEASQAVQATE